MADPLVKIRGFFSEKPKELTEKANGLQEKINAWTATQPAWVEGVVATVKGSGQGIFLGLVMGAVGKMNVESAAASGMPMQPQMLSMGGPVVQARNFAVMTGVNAGVSAFMKRVRGGKEDVNNQLVAAFCSGASFSLISGGITAPPAGAATPNPIMSAFSAGVVFALFQGAFYKLGEVWGGGSKEEESQYARAAAMLKSLGLAQYEKNLKRGKLNDATLALWDSDALRDVKIPPGPRLLILAHIDQYRHILKAAVPIPGQLPQE